MIAPAIYELHVNPTYAVCIPQRPKNNFNRTERQLKNEANLKDNKRKKGLSRKAIRRLCNAVNWLVASAKTKSIYEKETKKRFSFKINFITLTLPTTDHDITDNYFKKELLHNFINTCRVSHGLKNYVWKCEAQENGNIHVHFTTDTFIHWRKVRDVWNRILLKKGIIDKYTKKHENLTFEDYCSMYNPKNDKDVNRLRTAYNYGVSTKWQDPNSTDVHAVHKLNDVAAYLAKYMSKEEDDRRDIKGRLWGCSYNLSEQNKLVVEIQGNDDTEVLHELFKPEIEYKELTAVSSLTKLPFRVGEIFFYKLSDWGKVIRGKLLDLYNEHRFNIRHNINITRFDNNEMQPQNLTPVYQLASQSKQFNSSNQLKFNI